MRTTSEKPIPTVSWYWKRERNTRKAKAIECFVKPLRKTWQRGGCAALNELWFAIHEEIGTVSTQKPLQNMYKTGNIRYNLKDSQMKREIAPWQKVKNVVTMWGLGKACLAPSKGFGCESPKKNRIPVESVQSLLTADGMNPPREREREQVVHIHIPPFTGFLPENHRLKKCRETVGEMWSSPRRGSLKYTTIRL